MRTYAHTYTIHTLRRACSLIYLLFSINMYMCVYTSSERIFDFVRIGISTKSIRARIVDDISDVVIK